MTYSLEVTVYPTDPLLPSNTFRCEGGVARTLLYLDGRITAGATRIEAMNDEGILSLTQHVHILRRKGVEISTERVPHAGRDGDAKFGRYYLKGRVVIRHLSEGAS